MQQRETGRGFPKKFKSSKEVTYRVWLEGGFNMILEQQTVISNWILCPSSLLSPSSSVQTGNIEQEVCY